MATKSERKIMLHSFYLQLALPAESEFHYLPMNLKAPINRAGITTNSTNSN